MAAALACLGMAWIEDLHHVSLAPTPQRHPWTAAEDIGSGKRQDYYVPNIKPHALLLPQGAQADFFVI